MTVDAFVAKYRAGWQRLAELTSGRRNNLSRGDAIAEAVALYLRASAHLAEVQTRLHDREVEAYLTQVVAQAHAAIYGTRARSLRDAVEALGVRYRAAARRSAPFALVAGALLAVTILATLLWVTGSPEAQAGLLPGVAIDAIEEVGPERLDEGSPSPALSTFLFVHNVRVAMFAFALGVTLGIGTVYVLVSNGVFLGALAGSFHADGGGAVFWALVLPHGMLELTAIAVAAGAGLRVGWSIVDPGDRTRADALAEEARDALLVAMGIVPAFAIAAAIEGLVTGTALPTAVELGVGALAAAGYVAYVYLPRRPRPSSRDLGAAVTAARAI